MAVSQFTVASGGVNIEGVVIDTGVVDLNGVADALVIDADADTSISAPTDDQIDIELNGADDFTFTANRFNVLTGSAIAGPGSTFTPLVPLAAQQVLAGAGAVNITTYYTTIASGAGATAYSLVDGAVAGQLKKIQMITDGGGDAVLTPTNLSGGTTITFADIGDYCILGFNGTAWIVLELANQADGSTAPVLA